MTNLLRSLLAILLIAWIPVATVDQEEPVGPPYGDITLSEEEAFLDLRADATVVWSLLVQTLAAPELALRAEVPLDQWLLSDDIWLRLEPLPYKQDTWTRVRIRVRSFETEEDRERAQALLVDLASRLEAQLAGDAMVAEASAQGAQDLVAQEGGEVPRTYGPVSTWPTYVGSGVAVGVTSPTASVSYGVAPYPVTYAYLPYTYAPLYGVGWYSWCFPSYGYIYGFGYGPFGYLAAHHFGYHGLHHFGYHGFHHFGIHPFFYGHHGAFHGHASSCLCGFCSPAVVVKVHKQVHKEVVVIVDDDPDPTPDPVAGGGRPRADDDPPPPRGDDDRGDVPPPDREPRPEVAHTRGHELTPANPWSPRGERTMRTPSSDTTPPVARGDDTPSAPAPRVAPTPTATPRVRAVPRIRTVSVATTPVVPRSLPSVRQPAIVRRSVPAASTTPGSGGRISLPSPSFGPSHAPSTPSVVPTPPSRTPSIPAIVRTVPAQPPSAPTIVRAPSFRTPSAPTILRTVPTQPPSVPTIFRTRPAQPPSIPSRIPSRPSILPTSPIFNTPRVPNFRPSGTSLIGSRPSISVPSLRTSLAPTSLGTSSSSSRGRGRSRSSSKRR